MDDTSLRNRVLADGIHVLAGAAGGYMLAEGSEHALMLPMLTVGAEAAMRGIEELVAPYHNYSSLNQIVSHAFYQTCMKALEGATCAGLAGAITYGLTR